MFPTLPQTFQQYKVPADVRTLFELQTCMQHGMVSTLGDLYVVLQGLVVHKKEMTGPFTAAFYDYFLGISVAPGQPLEEAVQNSKAFHSWKSHFLETSDSHDLALTDLIDRFFDYVHTTTLGIGRTVDGSILFDQDDPNRVDTGESREAPRHNILVDYSTVALKDLEERLRKVAEAQRERHSGGDHWIGTDGYSPFGHDGYVQGGIRVGGRGRLSQARRVFGDMTYFPVDSDAVLSDTSIDACLAALQGLLEPTSHKLLDIDATIDQGVRRGGIFVPVCKEKLENTLQMLLFMDNGGFSMSSYTSVVQQLFGRMKRRVNGNLRTFYFHNILHQTVSEDERRLQSTVPLENLVQTHTKDHVFVIGDAHMAPDELFSPSNRESTPLAVLKYLRAHFPKLVWLNPLQEDYWQHPTVSAIGKVVPMFPLTPVGIEQAVLYLNKQR
ncbi:hypothetical protein J4208_00905 [Candidatus Woesearchaeota archaeon]|nr:hypothetical protein [Candidatus Woesearchaeota archaeon]